MIRASATRLMVVLEKDLVAFIDQECFRLERGRSFVIEKALTRWARDLRVSRGRRIRHAEGMAAVEAGGDTEGQGGCHVAGQ